jgi:rhodanese-related sulfurtransferase
MDGEVPQIAPAAAHRLLAAGDAVAVDVREADEWQVGRMPDSTWVPLSELAGRIAELPDAPLVIVCRTGSRSGMVAEALVSMGREASNLAGGLVAWRADGFALEPDDGYVL